jgi:hypothetical protein
LFLINWWKQNIEIMNFTIILQWELFSSGLLINLHCMHIYGVCVCVIDANQNLTACTFWMSREQIFWRFNAFADRFSDAVVLSLLCISDLFLHHKIEYPLPTLIKSLIMPIYPPALILYIERLQVFLIV